MNEPECASPDLGTTRGVVAIMLLGALAVPGAAWAEEQWQCDKVIDGDTLVLTQGARRQTVQLFGIDAPELAQEEGEAAKQLLEHAVEGKTVELEPKSAGAGSIVGIVSVEGEDVAEQLLRSGLAWLSNQGDTSQHYALLVFQARGSHLGVFAHPDPEHPELWRKRQPRTTPTPEPRTLADIAGQIELTGSVIDDIPSIRAKSREAQLFLDRAVALARQAQVYRGLQRAYEIYCEHDQSEAGQSASSATVWSEKEQAWVDAAPAESKIDCNLVKEKYTAGLDQVRKDKATAVADARHFGVDAAFIDQVLDALKLRD